MAGAREIDKWKTAVGEILIGNLRKSLEVRADIRQTYNNGEKSRLWNDIFAEFTNDGIEIKSREYLIDLDQGSKKGTKVSIANLLGFIRKRELILTTDASEFNKRISRKQQAIKNTREKLSKALKSRRTLEKTKVELAARLKKQEDELESLKEQANKNSAALRLAIILRKSIFEKGVAARNIIDYWDGLNQKSEALDIINQGLVDRLLGKI